MIWEKSFLSGQPSPARNLLFFSELSVPIMSGLRDCVGARGPSNRRRWSPGQAANHPLRRLQIEGREFEHFSRRMRFAIVRFEICPPQSQEKA
jgi:hypothetical protein